MAEQQTMEVGEDLDVAANDAVINDVGSVDGDGIGSPTHSAERQDGYDKAASNPDVVEAFDAVFGSGGPSKAPDAKATRGSDRRRKVEIDSRRRGTCLASPNASIKGDWKSDAKNEGRQERLQSSIGMKSRSDCQNPFHRSPTPFSMARASRLCTSLPPHSRRV